MLFCFSFFSFPDEHVAYGKIKTSQRKIVTWRKKKKEREQMPLIWKNISPPVSSTYMSYIWVWFFHLYVLTETVFCSLVQSVHCIAAAPPALLIANSSNIESVPQTPVSQWQSSEASIVPHAAPVPLSQFGMFYVTQQMPVRRTSLTSAVLGFVLLCSLAERTLTFISGFDRHCTFY